LTIHRGATVDIAALALTEAAGRWPALPELHLVRQPRGLRVVAKWGLQEAQGVHRRTVKEGFNAIRRSRLLLRSTRTHKVPLGAGLGPGRQTTMQPRKPFRPCWKG
jgi:hypothetical protein